MLRDHSSWVLGNGESIRVWEDDWLGVGMLRGYVAGPLSKEEDSLKVRDLVVDGEWKFDKISFDLPICLCDQIKSIPLPLPQDVDDIITPHFAHIQGFSLGDAYAAMIQVPQVDLDWVWKGKGEPKLKFFFWLLWLDRLPHRNMLTIRNIVTDTSCPRCPGGPENSNHIIRDCPHSQEVWTICTPPIPCDLPF